MCVVQLSDVCSSLLLCELMEYALILDNGRGLCLGLLLSDSLRVTCAHTTCGIKEILFLVVVQLVHCVQQWDFTSSYIILSDQFPSCVTFTSCGNENMSLVILLFWVCLHFGVRSSTVKTLVRNWVCCCRWVFLRKSSQQSFCWGLKLSHVESC